MTSQTGSALSPVGGGGGQEMEIWIHGLYLATQDTRGNLGNWAGE